MLEFLLWGGYVRLLIVRDFTYINDIVEGVIRVIDTPAKQDPDYNHDIPKLSISDAPIEFTTSVMVVQ